MDVSAALSAFGAHVGDDRSSLIDRREQASLAVALLELARARKSLATPAPLELIHGSRAARVVSRQATTIARRHA